MEPDLRRTGSSSLHDGTWIGETAVAERLAGAGYPVVDELPPDGEPSAHKRAG